MGDGTGDASVPVPGPPQRASYASLTREVDLKGRTLGDFLVAEKIGEGGFGAVYRAHQPLLDRAAVIKVLQTRHRATGAPTERFLREARLASRLDHPYAAHIYAFGAESDGTLWIAMELVRGTTLSEYLRVHGPLTVERFVPLLERICEVVHSAHEQGIIHRDLKPANVMVLARAGRLLPKLLDFGIAKSLFDAAASDADEENPLVDVPDESVGMQDTLMPPSPEATVVGPRSGGHGPQKVSFSGKLTQRGAVMGSPHYMAPEQWQDAATVTARTDLYALGVLAYEALTGAPPFRAGNMSALAVAHTSEAVPPLSPSLPKALDAAFARALAKRPEDRYETALDMAAAFRTAAGLAGEKRPLPQLDEAIRQQYLADAPQPIAEAIASLDGARDGRQARDALWTIPTVLGRWLAVIALATRSRLGPSHDAPGTLAAVRELGTAVPHDDSWIELAHTLLRGYAGSPDLHPVPELVLFACEPGGEPGVGVRMYRELIAQRPALADATANDDEVVTRLRHALVLLSTLLREASFVCKYPLLLPAGDGFAERWSGTRRAQRTQVVARGTVLAGRPILVDQDGSPVIALHPVAQVAEPAPGVARELFLFAGRDQRGGKLTASPLPFELHDSQVLDWLRVQMASTLDPDHAGSSGERAPYRGLLAFTSDDASFYVGREQAVDGFVNRLRMQPLVAVVGPSGAGKSSFVQAGVIPALGADWRAIIVRPGHAPFVALASRVQAAGVRASELPARLREDPARLGDLLRDRAATNGSIVLVIDQLEELFTLTGDDADRRAFAAAIASAARAVDDPVRVVMTLRDDFLVATQELPSLRDRVAQGLHLLTTPTREELERILVEPARRVGYEFEDPELPARMVAEIADRPGALALLSFTAARLWEHRDRHFQRLSTRAYEQLGGVAGALARHADRVLDDAPGHEQRMIREAFRHLVTAAGTRATLTRDELVTVLGGGASANDVVERLVASRLLVASEGDTAEQIEIAHEALIEAWPRLLAWRREDAENSRLRDQLRDAARQWDSRGRPRGLLWRDDALLEYRLWRARYPGRLTSVEEAFAATSLAAFRRSRIRLVAVALSLPIVATATYATIEVRSRRHVAAEIDRRVTEARRQLEQARQGMAAADKARTSALALFDGQQFVEAEARWQEARTASQQAEQKYGLAMQPIESALMLDPERGVVRGLLADILFARALFADREGRLAQRDELIQRLALYDDGRTRRDVLGKPAQLGVRIEPPDAFARLERYQIVGSKRQVQPVRDVSSGATLSLEPGSYRLTVARGTGGPTYYPIELERGESLAVAITVPDQVPDGFTYIPPGRFVVGSADEAARRDFLGTVPAHAARTHGFLIARHETTFADWLQFLDALPQQERAARTPRSASSANGAVTLERVDGRWRVTMVPTTHRYVAFAGEKIIYRERDKRIEQDWLKMPVAGVSFDDARAYAAWAAASGRIPGARLCTEHEWERAARGADAREFPTGDQLDPDDANFDETYGKRSLAFGPDEVGSHPASTSPFGVHDLSGNVWEWTEGSMSSDRIVLRGGSYYHGKLTGRSTNRWPVEPAARELVIGFRLCADAPAKLR